MPVVDAVVRSNQDETGEVLVDPPSAEEHDNILVLTGAGLAGVAVSDIAAAGPALGPVYLASEGAGVYRSDDRGRSWVWTGDEPGSLLARVYTVRVLAPAAD